MAAPVVTASLNKPVNSAGFAKGEVMILTVAYSDADSAVYQITVVGTDASGNVSPPASLSYVVDPIGITVKDSGPAVWVKQSDTGSVAVFKATA